jgi:uncharacterized protein YecA (UPF0149 family)
MIEQLKETIKRHKPCPCGSGLKFKKCHDSIEIREQCKTAAALTFMRCITPLRLKAGVIKQEEHDHLMSQINTSLIEMVTGKVNDSVVESEDLKAERTVESVQETMKLDRCPECGRCVPAGTECIKCKEKVQ